jgi:hypothetical protein
MTISFQREMFIDGETCVINCVIAFMGVDRHTFFSQWFPRPHGSTLGRTEGEDFFFALTLTITSHCHVSLLYVLLLKTLSYITTLQPYTIISYYTSYYHILQSHLTITSNYHILQPSPTTISYYHLLLSCLTSISY